VTFDGPLISDDADVPEGSLGIYPFFAFSDVAQGPGTASPGGTSRGTNAVWIDLDPRGALTVTWDDIVPDGDFAPGAVNAFQLRLIDGAIAPGGPAGEARVELRYEEIGWYLDDDPFSFSGPPEIGFRTASDPSDPGDFGRFVPIAEDEEAAFELPDRGVLEYRLTAAGIEGLEDEGAPILGTPGPDLLIGTDGDDAIFARGGAGDVVRPGLGNDVIDFGRGETLVAGRPEELFGSELRNPGWNDRLLFEGVAFDAGDVDIFELALGFSFEFDIPGVDIPFQTIELPLVGAPDGSVLTSTTAEGTYLGFVRNLPLGGTGDAVRDPSRFEGDQSTQAYLRGAGPTDYEIRLLGDPPEPGLAIGAYEADEDGRIVSVRLAEAGATPTGEPLRLADVGAGHEVGAFVFRPEDPSDLDGDAFRFASEDGSAATLSDGPARLLDAAGDEVAGALFLGPHRGLDGGGQRALIGAVPDAPGLALAFETGDLASADFADVVLSIERLAVDPI
jgi:hypothetical protein